MKTRTKMMIMNAGRRGSQGGQRGARSEYDGARSEYREPRSEYREPRSGYGYDTMDGRSGRMGNNYDYIKVNRYEMPRNEYHPQNREMMGEWEPQSGYPKMGWPMFVEGRFRDRRGREHYDNGRYAPMRSEFDDDMEDGYRGYPAFPYPSPVYQRDGGRPMNRIGFVAPTEFEQNYGTSAEMPRMNEMGHSRSEMTPGHAKGMEMEPFTHETAMKWVQKMKNADGTTGPHWTMEQAKQVMEQQRIQADELEFYVALNMMYSDYCKVAKKHNCSTMEFYSAMAKAFLDDKDAHPDKLALYYECIVKH